MQVKLMNKPLITMISRRFEAASKERFGYVRFYRADHMAAGYYARWWLSPFLWFLCDFSYFFDVRGIEMRLDAPEFIRAHEREPICLPFHGAVMDWIMRHMEAIKLMRIE